MMCVDLTDNAIAEARWSFTHQRLFPEMDEDEIKEGWREFCQFAVLQPMAAAVMEAEAMRQSRIRRDS